MVLRLPRPLITMGFVDVDAADNAGISILMGLSKYGELTLAGFTVMAVDVVAVFFSAYAAAVSRSMPPPEPEGEMRRDVNHDWIYN